MVDPIKITRRLITAGAIMLALSLPAAAQQAQSDSALQGPPGPQGPPGLSQAIDGGTRPVPDPTVLTTQQLAAAVVALQREIDLRQKITETRLDGNDAAVTLLRTSTDRFPAFVDARVNQLRDLQDEKFSSIETQFKERDIRVEQTSRDSKVAIDAALQAQKESVDKQNESNAQAIAKQEAAFTKQIDAIGLLIEARGKATDDKFDDLKTRLTTIEGNTTGASNLWGIIVGGLGLLFGAIMVVVAVMRHIQPRGA